MESQTSTQLKVGIFLSIGIILILGSIFLLGADRALFTSYVRLHAHFDQVQGLSEGSVVSLSGITVGNVESITFLPEKNLLNVQMRINEDYIPRIRQGSQVEIRTQGALGDKFVFIIPGDPANPVVKENEILDVARATDLLGIISERGNETNKLFDIIDELHKLTLTLNAENRMGRILANFENASAGMNRLVGQMSPGSGEKLNESVEKLDSILTKIDKGQGTLGALINDPSLHDKLKALLGGSSQKNHVKTLLRTSIEKDSGN